MKVKFIKAKQMEWEFLKSKENINIMENGEMENQMVMAL